MSVNGLSSLIVTIMAAGRVDALDATDPRLAHEALVRLSTARSAAAQSVLRRFGVVIHTRADPEVGRRVAGLTRATWDAVSAGDLAPQQSGHRAWFALKRSGDVRAQRLIRGLPAEEAACLHEVGAFWASRSTDLKNRPKASSVGSMAPLRLA